MGREPEEVPSNTIPDIRKPSGEGAAGDVGAGAAVGCLELELSRSHAANKDMATTNTMIGFFIANTLSRSRQRCVQDK